MTTQKTISIYADTSVFGGVFDDEFNEPSKAFGDTVVSGRFIPVTSELVRQEIAAAPDAVRQLFDCVRMKRQGAEQVMKQLEGKTIQE